MKRAAADKLAPTAAVSQFPVHEVAASIPGRSAFGQQPWASCSHAYASAANRYT